MIDSNNSRIILLQAWSKADGIVASLARLAELQIAAPGESLKKTGIAKNPYTKLMTRIPDRLWSVREKQNLSPRELREDVPRHEGSKDLRKPSWKTSLDLRYPANFVWPYPPRPSIRVVLGWFRNRRRYFVGELLRSRLSIYALHKLIDRKVEVLHSVV